MPNLTTSDCLKKLALSENVKAREVLLNELTDDEKLNFRAVNHDCSDVVKKTATSAYANKKAFVAGVTGLYKDIKYLDVAWTLYHRTLSSSSYKPAALYKMKDWNGLLKNRKISEFADNENLGDTGRLYCPGDLHIWAVNRSWLLAQFHKGRDVQLLSEVNDEVKLSNNPVTYSAFAKEISAVINADYEISDITGYDVKLSPIKKPKQFITVWDIAPQTSDSVHVISLFKNSYEESFNALKTARIIADLYTKLKANGDEDKLAEQIQDCFVNSENKKIYLQSVLKELNKKFPHLRAIVESAFEKTKPSLSIKSG